MVDRDRVGRHRQRGIERRVDRDRLRRDRLVRETQPGERALRAELHGCIRTPQRELAGRARAVEHESLGGERRERAERDLVAVNGEREARPVGRGRYELDADRARDAAVVDEASRFEWATDGEPADRDVAQRDGATADVDLAGAGDREHAAKHDARQREVGGAACELDLAVDARVAGAHAELAGDQANAVAVGHELDIVGRTLRRCRRRAR